MNAFSEELKRQLNIAIQDGDAGRVNQLNEQIRKLNEINELHRIREDTFKGDLYGSVISGGFDPDID